MKKLFDLPQKFRLRLDRGGEAHVVYRLSGKNELRYDGVPDGSPKPADVLWGRCGHETLPDPGAAFADGILHALGGGIVFDERPPALVKAIRKACEIPEGGIS